MFILSFSFLCVVVVDGDLIKHLMFFFFKYINLSKGKFIFAKEGDERGKSREKKVNGQ